MYMVCLRCLIAFLCCLGPSCLQAQSGTALLKDSLEVLLNDLQSEVRDIPEFRERADKVFHQLRARPADSLSRHYLTQFSLALVDFPDSSLFHQVNRAAIAANRRGRDSLALANTLWDRAYRMEKESRRDSAFYLYSKARNILKSIEKQGLVAQLSLRIGTLQNLLKDYLGAEATLVTALRQYEAAGNQRGLFNAYSSLGMNAKDQGLYEESFQYYREARKHLENLDAESRDWNAFYNNLGNVYRASGDLTTALEYYRSALEGPGLRETNPSSYALYITNLGKASYEMGRYTEAETAYLEALEVRDSLGSPAQLASSHYFLAELYAKTGRDSLARTHLFPGLELARQGDSPERLLELYVLGGQLEPDSAAAYLKHYRDLNEQIQKAELDERNRFARIQFETDQYIEQNEFLARRQVMYVGLLAGVLLLGISIVIIVSQRIKNQKLRFEQKQQEANQEIFQLMLSQKERVEEGKKTVQRRISEELHDGVLGEMNGVRMVLLGLNGKKDPKSESLREQAIVKLQQIQEEIRGISHELNDAAYAKFHNFILSVEEMIAQNCEPAGLSYVLKYDQNVDWDQVPGLVKINLYRILQECLQNTIKHARASRVEIQLEGDVDGYHLRVQDNGTGLAGGRGRKGIGLKNIDSRVAKMAGSWEVSSKRGKGTTVRIAIPRSKGNHTPAG